MRIPSSSARADGFGTNTISPISRSGSSEATVLDPVTQSCLYSGVDNAAPAPTRNPPSMPTV
ncbi:Uncharacterised protein [Mycobacterium tuberculosis]|uniref:Uncharacterized protein n=1 Tax=Mycobacterium tuberculosis TaxID=1773 RepID=A0A0U0UQ85_MYCTX|nr:Uncharacterised protein [Mycobacterium tuberculosis]COZ04353.1 Uncharacterised protein [Mycobacterium tuberculosis]CPA77346.1 Uncharacterised protein [Mycobacterium tuberculosis]CPA80293.1 Uncharacterised protein [Mycobacterium tuberculosis]